MKPYESKEEKEESKYESKEKYIKDLKNLSKQLKEVIKKEKNTSATENDKTTEETVEFALCNQLDPENNSKEKFWMKASGMFKWTEIEKELLNFQLEDKTHIGIVLSFIATFWASTGNLIHQKNAKDNIPFIQSISYGMLYGSIFTLIVAKFRGAEIIFDNSVSYILSLLYLSIIGSVVAFYLYLKLLESIGSARAGYIGVIMPIIAIIISTIFEGLQWTNNLIFGLPVLIFGCVLILNQKSKNI